MNPNQGANIKKVNIANNRKCFLLNLSLDIITLVALIYYVVPRIKKPVLLLIYPRTWYLIISFLIFAVWAFLCVAASFVIKRICKCKTTRPLAISLVLHIIVLALLLCYLIASCVSFSKNLGVVSILNKKELEYLNNYPSGNYSIEKDIDYSGKDWKTISVFKGSISGNDHVITNIKLDKDGFIKKNRGTINNLNMKNVLYSDFDVYCDYGTLVHYNDGEIRECTIANDDNSNQPLAAKLLIGVNNSVSAGNTKVNIAKLKPLLKHYYRELEHIDSTCTAKGSSKFFCGVCGANYSESIPVSDAHLYKTVSYTKHRNNNVCVYCKDRYYSFRPGNLAWIIIFAVALIAFFFAIYLTRKKGGSITSCILIIVLLVVCALIPVFHFKIVDNQTSGEQFYDSWLVDPPNSECKFAETSREKSTYTQPGTVVYKCKDCGDTYSEYLPKKEVSDWRKLKTYSEKTIKEISEKELNGIFTKANKLPALSRMSGNLNARDDIDLYKFSVSSKSNVSIEFSHNGEGKQLHWNLTVYAYDAKTVLTDRNIPAVEAGKIKTVDISGLDKGAYYIKISPAKIGNYSFSKAKYHISVKTECETHLAEKPYITKKPTCTEGGEYVIACGHCNQVLETVSIDKTGHSFGIWIVTQNPTADDSGEKERACKICGEKETADF